MSVGKVAQPFSPLGFSQGLGHITTRHFCGFIYSFSSSWILVTDVFGYLPFTFYLLCSLTLVLFNRDFHSVTFGLMCF